MRYCSQNTNNWVRLRTDNLEVMKEATVVTVGAQNLSLTSTAGHTTGVGDALTKTRLISIASPAVSWLML